MGHHGRPAIEAQPQRLRSMQGTVGERNLTLSSPLCNTGPLRDYTAIACTHTPQRRTPYGLTTIPYHPRTMSYASTYHTLKTTLHGPHPMQPLSSVLRATPNHTDTALPSHAYLNTSEMHILPIHDHTTRHAHPYTPTIHSNCRWVLIQIKTPGLRQNTLCRPSSPHP